VVSGVKVAKSYLIWNLELFVLQLYSYMCNIYTKLMKITTVCKM